jgi:protease PrsW
MVMPTAREYGRASGRRRRAWRRIFGVGATLWLACLVTIGVTGNPALVPSLILLGSFLVPVTFVAWAFETWRDEDVTTELLVVAFVVGGLLGAMGASVLEAYVLSSSPLLFLGVGLIEEGAKLAALLLVTRRMRPRHTRDGVVLGAAVGFGFAAFESAGYAFEVLISSNGSLLAMIQTELLRGLLAPLGHGLWTAILGGVVFHHLAADARRPVGWAGRRPAGWSEGRPPARLGEVLRRRGVVLAYLWVAVLHALWDSMHELALTAVLLLTATPTQRRLLDAGYLPPETPQQQHLVTGVSYGGLAVVSVFGLGTLAVIWLRSRRERRRGSGMVLG